MAAHDIFIPLPSCPRTVLSLGQPQTGWSQDVADVIGRTKVYAGNGKNKLIPFYLLMLGFFVLFWFF